jgi:hypothetical protein
MRVVALAIFAAIASPGLGQQPIPTCMESVTSYRTNLAQQFKIDTLLQVRADEAATFFVISDVLTVAEDNRRVQCQGTLTVRKEIENALKTRPASNHAANPLEISASVSLIMTMMNAGTITPVRWEIIRFDDGGLRVRSITNP